MTNGTGLRAGTGRLLRRARRLGGPRVMEAAGAVLFALAVALLPVFWSRQVERRCEYCGSRDHVVRNGERWTCLPCSHCRAYLTGEEE